MLYLCNRKHKLSINRMSSESRAELGIAKYHFEIEAGKELFEWV